MSFRSGLAQLARRSLFRRSRCLPSAGRAFQYASPTSTIGAQRHQRHMSTPPPQDVVSDLSVEKYHALSDQTMDTLLEELETLLDSLGNPEYEVEYHSGVLTLSLSDKGTYVINKQPPNKQIWLSSPFSGPKRYDYVSSSDDWIYSREGKSLGDLLNEELSKVVQHRVDLGLKNPSSKLTESLFFEALGSAAKKVL